MGYLAKCPLPPPLNALFPLLDGQSVSIHLTLWFQLLPLPHSPVAEATGVCAPDHADARGPVDLGE